MVLFELVTVPWLMVYSPTMSPAARVSDPLRVSLLTSAPTAVVKVSSGSASPYVLVFATAVTVMGLALMVTVVPRFVTGL